MLQLVLSSSHMIDINESKNYYYLLIATCRELHKRLKDGVPFTKHYSNR